MTIQQALEFALQHHQSGQLAEAERIYRQILAVEPRNSDALHLLGAIAQQVGRNDVAVDLISQAVSANPNHFAAFSNLGTVLRVRGQFAEAIDAYRRALELDPDSAMAHCDLGKALRDVGQLDEAILELRKALQIDAGFAEAYNHLGNALHDQCRIEEAIVAYRRAIQIKPNFPHSHNNLGNVLRGIGQIEEAAAECRKALQIDPVFAEAHNNLGNALADQGRIEEAVGAYRQAIQIKPGYAQAHNNLGNALRTQGRIDEAIEAYRRAVELTSQSGELPRRVGKVVNEPTTELERIRPHASLPEAHSNLGNALGDTGQIEAAIDVLRLAVAQRPGFAAARSNLVFLLNYHPGVDARDMAAEQRWWSQQHAEPLRQFIRPHGNDRDPERRLRIGYVSPDFWQHVAAHFLVPLLESHDHARFEIYCYASVKRRDAITERMGRSAAVWRDVLGMSDEALAAQIREDRIDLLVDLSQHTAGNRLLVFARQPAPVQVAWLGYPGSTGLEAIGYRLTDAVLEPEGAVWAESVERAVRLPDAWFCFDPIDVYPEPGPLPALAAGQITFGSLNNFCKVNAAVLRLWVEVLRKVEGSRLLLQCPAGATQARMRQWFEGEGIAASRLELVARTATRAEFLRHFARIDVALETFPYNGGTTTCEALWMGVPVPSFGGATAVARIGLSILSACGLRELIAGGPEDYVRVVASLAGDLPRLAALRATLRGRLQASAFMDAPRFARSVEAAYRTMWRQWCAQPTPGRAS